MRNPGGRRVDGAAVEGLVRPHSGCSGQTRETSAFTRRKSPRLVRISNDDGNSSALFNSLLGLDLFRDGYPIDMGFGPFCHCPDYG
jgi:hypothetical protein